MEDKEIVEEKKRKLEVTPEGAGALGTGGGVLLIDFLMSRGSPGGILLAGIGAWVMGRHTSGIMYTTKQIAGKFVRSPEQNGESSDYSFTDRLFGKHLSEQESAPASKPLAQDVPKPSMLSRLMGKPNARMVELGKNLQLDIDDIAGKAIFICGIRRSGKTTLGVRIAEQLGNFNIPMLIPDLKGDWLSCVNTLPNAIILGKGEATEDNAKAHGYAICEDKMQIILDVTSYDDMNEVARVIAGMIDGVFLWERNHPDNRQLCGVFLDEAQSFLPQDVKDSIISETEARDAMQNAYMRVIAIGGSLGLFPVVLTQRIAQTSNKVIGQPELLFLFKQTLDNDLRRYQNFTRVPVEQVRALKQGQGIFVSYEGDSSIHTFHKRTSSDAMSATPRYRPTPETQALDEEDLDFEEVTMSATSPVVAFHPLKAPVRHVSEDDRKVKRAYQYWQEGHASVRKLEAVSGWSNGETRRVIRLMKERRLIEQV